MAFWRQIPVVGAGALAIGLSAAPSDARDSAHAACASTYEDALAHQQAGHLREARTLALQCARSACGNLQKKCAASAAKLRSEIAWIAPVVTDEKGTPLVDAQVTLDDQPLASRLDGRELPVDPGVHELTVTAKVGKWPGHEVTTTRKVMIVQGQRGPVAIALPSSDDETPALQAASASDSDSEPSPAKPTASDSSPEASPPEETHADGTAGAHTQHHGPSAWPFVIGSVGVLGLGAGALLTYWGKTDNDALAACSPNCAASSVAHIRTLYLGADISFGVGGAALGVAALLFLTSHSSSREAPSNSAVFDVRPTRSGAVATFQGVF
jgi:hypothetical protein